MLLIFKALFENNSVFVYSNAVRGANLRLIGAGAIFQGTCGEAGGAAIRSSLEVSVLGKGTWSLFPEGLTGNFSFIAQKENRPRVQRLEEG